METNRFLQLRKIFDEAALIPASEWETFLPRACGGDESLCAEARALLRAHQNAATTAVMAEKSQPARMVGAYRILRELGSGGMGVVYLAVRDDGTFRKNVAVKLLKRNHASPELVQRFHLERQVLANLDHPNVARLLDGGQTDEGLPYYVMEYVEGLALDRFCDTQKLDLADRIRLFQQVVAAVQYLHENLVVHRDLKHSNILVTGDGLAKLLDFGIAKSQTLIPESPDLTGPANRLLTPNYASPEQISGAPVSKASDIYSLGVILYELLTGRLPYADATSKLSGEPPLPSANIREDLQRTPETTSQLRRRIVGDLDQIVLLCLRRDPRHRYASAAALDEDLRRFLEGRSVIARKEPFVERTLRFLKRNRTAVAVVVLVLLSISVGGWKTLQAHIQTRQVEARESEVKRLLDSLERQKGANPSVSPAQRGSPTSPVSSPGARLEDIRKLRRALEQDLAAAWSMRPGDTPARRALLERTARYLDSARALAPQDVALASELAGAYKELGVLYEPNSQDLALIAYRNAALVIEDASGGNPDHGPNQVQWTYIVARIKGLGGTIPVYRIAGIPGSRPSPPAGHPGPDSPSPPIQDNSHEEAPDAVVLAAPAVDPAQYNEVKRSLDFAIAKGGLAEQTMQEIEEGMAKLEQSVHPDIKSHYVRMKRALDTASQALKGGDLAAAKENIGIANECARRVLKEGGR